MANTAYALFDKTNQKITFKYNTELTSNLNVNGLSMLSNLSVPVTATINTANVTTGNITTGNITTGNITTANVTTGNVTTGNITTGNITTGNVTTLIGNVATLSNLTVVQTTNTSNLIGNTATLSNINNKSFNGNVATLSNITITETATLTNLTALSSSLSNISVSGRQLTCTNPEGYRIRLNQNNAEFTIDNVNFGRLTFIGNDFGINTVTPTEALDVTGNAKISGDATVNGNISLGTFTSTIMKPVQYKYTTSLYSSTNPSSFTNVAQLNFNLDANSFYTFKALLVVNTNGAGFKLQPTLTAAGNGTIGNWTVTSLPSPTANQYVFDGGSTNDIAIFTSLPLTDRNIITIEGRIWTNNADTLKINIAPNTTGTAAVTYFSTIEWNGVPSWL